MRDPAMQKKTASFAEEAFVVDVQSFLHQMMIDKGFTRSQLAEAMGVSRARVTQVFSDECKNFTIRFLARAFFALGEEPRVSRASQWESQCRDAEIEKIFASVRFDALPSCWDMGVANDDDADDWDAIECEPDRRISAALTDSARRQRIQKANAYA